MASLIGANSPLALEGAEEAQAAQIPPSPAAATGDATKVADASATTDEGPAEQGDAGGNDESVDATPADAHTGWRIQIAATPSQAGAEEMLDRALSKGGKVLAHASPYTEPVKSGSGTIYRARFAGFSGKEAARGACAYLIKHKLSCLAVASD